MCLLPRISQNNRMRAERAMLTKVGVWETGQQSALFRPTYQKSGLFICYQKKTKKQHKSTLVRSSQEVEMHTGYLQMPCYYQNVAFEQHTLNVNQKYRWHQMCKMEDCWLWGRVEEKKEQEFCDLLTSCRVTALYLNYVNFIKYCGQEKNLLSKSKRKELT